MTRHDHTLYLAATSVTAVTTSGRTTVGKAGNYAVRHLRNARSFQFPSVVPNVPEIEEKDEAMKLV
jgi:hypothetical protein